MTKSNVLVVHKSHHWVLITHKRGYARYCMRCGKLRYYGRHKDFSHLNAYAPEAIDFGHVNNPDAVQEY